MNLSRLDEARAAFEQSLSIDPDFSEAAMARQSLSELSASGDTKPEPS